MTAQRVFLDANVIISAGKPPGGPEIARVIDLVEADLIAVLTTDLTVTEVAKKHTQNDFGVIKEICQPHFRRIVQEATGVELPEVSRPELRETLKDSYQQLTDQMFEALKAKALTIDGIKPSLVFDAYSSGEGFFASSGKKDQFPDAFIFECLRNEATAETPVIIVSNDGDFENSVETAEHITLVKSLPDLFQSLGLEMEAPEVDAFLDAQKAELQRAINRELVDWGLHSEDVMDAEIDEITVDAIEITNCTAFGSVEEGEPILVIGTVDASALISFSHPNWDTAMYDSEDKVLIPFEDVSGEAEIEISLDISLLITVDETGEMDNIEQLRFRNSGFQYVTLYPYETYK